MASAAHLETSVNQDSLSSGGRLVTSKGEALPLRRTHLQARARAGIAQTVLQQTFVNPHDEPLVVSYALPLPVDGAVSGFRFTVAGKTIVGEVDKKHRARERFEEAIATGRTAALIEQQRANQFHQRVGNIPPKAEILCEVVVDQPLTWLSEGAWEWRFPTVVGPRYMGAAGRVPDAAALQVPFTQEGTGVTAHLSLTVADAIPPSYGPSSPSHALRCDAVGSETRVELSAQDGVALDRDVIVRWQVATPDVGVSVEMARPASERSDSKRAYALLTLVPPAAGAIAPQARDLIFLIDTSGSMHGEPLQQAARIASAMIDSLEEGDQLELISFGDRPVRWKPEPVLATRDGKRAAIRWVKGLRASGGTEMRDAIIEALQPLRPGAQRQVVLITDGYIGFENEILREIHDRLPRGARLHTVGVGSAPNRALTEPAARAGGGVEVMLGLGEDPEPGARRLLQRTVAPLVTDVTISGEGVVTAPGRLPDLYAGSPALVCVELPAEGATVHIGGAMGDGTYIHVVELPGLALGGGNSAVAALYGRAWAAELEVQRAMGDHVGDIDQTLEQVGLRFQIATRMTSWIAVDEEVRVDPNRRIDREMPHEIPFGMSVEGVGLRPAMNAPQAMGGAVLMAESMPVPAAAPRARSLEMETKVSRRGKQLRQEKPKPVEAEELDELSMDTFGVLGDEPEPADRFVAQDRPSTGAFNLEAEDDRTEQAAADAPAPEQALLQETAPSTSKPRSSWLWLLVVLLVALLLLIIFAIGGV